MSYTVSTSICVVPLSKCRNLRGGCTQLILARFKTSGELIRLKTAKALGIDWKNQQNMADSSKPRVKKGSQGHSDCRRRYRCIRLFKDSLIVKISCISGFRL